MMDFLLLKLILKKIYHKGKLIKFYKLTSADLGTRGKFQSTKFSNLANHILFKFHQHVLFKTLIFFSMVKNAKLQSAFDSTLFLSETQIYYLVLTRK